MRAHIEMCRLREQGLGREISPWDWRLQETCGCVLTQVSPGPRLFYCRHGSTGEGGRFTQITAAQGFAGHPRACHIVHPLLRERLRGVSQEVGRGSNSKRTQARGGGKVAFVRLHTSAGYKWRLQEAWRKARLLGPMKCRRDSQ